MRAREIIFSPTETMAFSEEKVAQRFDSERPETPPEVERLLRKWCKRNIRELKRRARGK